MNFIAQEDFFQPYLFYEIGFLLVENAGYAPFFS
jgi:hypothetical protein